MIIEKGRDDVKKRLMLTTVAIGLGIGMYAISPITSEAASVATTPAQQQFIESVGEDARVLAGDNDLYASVMIAQAILESNWGQSKLASPPNHNLFGIKGDYNGASVMIETSEFVNNKWIKVNAAFKKYPSYNESLLDNVHKLKTRSFSPGVYYYAGAWKSNAPTYQDATAFLTGKYATDPQYNQKLNRLIESYDLTQYDQPSADSVALYRLYNPNSGEHFYTYDTNEKQHLVTVGWRYESIAWHTSLIGDPVYRVYNPNSGDHHYTTQQQEVNHLVSVGWRAEGISFYSTGAKEILRVYNPNAKTGTHHYTFNAGEKQALVNQGWHDEGVGFYGE